MATTFGIVYGIKTNIVRRIIIPDTDEELKFHPMVKGETMLIVPKGPSDIFTCRELVARATKKPSPSARHAVIDKKGMVVEIALIDPVLDGKVLFPGRRFVQSETARIGDKL